MYSHTQISILFRWTAVNLIHPRSLPLLGIDDLVSLPSLTHYRGKLECTDLCIRSKKMCRVQLCTAQHVILWWRRFWVSCTILRMLEVMPIQFYPYSEYSSTRIRYDWVKSPDNTSPSFDEPLYLFKCYSVGDYHASPSLSPGFLKQPSFVFKVSWLWLSKGTSLVYSVELSTSFHWIFFFPYAAGWLYIAHPSGHHLFGWLLILLECSATAVIHLAI